MVQMDADKVKKRSSKNNLLVLKCDCGHEILLLPDLKTLGRIIDEHVLEHKRKFALTQKEVDALVDSLVAQALRLASEMESSSVDVQVGSSAKKRRKKKFGD
jgi:hypothetical protein